MSIISSSLQIGYDRQKKSLIEQIESAGSLILDCIESGSEESKASSAITSTLKGLVGRGRLEPDYWQIFLLERNNRKQVYVQPYSGSTILPGEHHLYLNGSIDCPVVLEDTALFGGPVWASSNDTFAKRLNKDEKELKKAIKNVVFDWAIGTGKVTHEWTIQIFSIGNGNSKLVMQAGRYGGIMTYNVGFDELNKIVDALEIILKKDTNQKQIPMKRSAYDDISDNILGISLPPDELETQNQSTTLKMYNAIITNTVRPYLGKQVFLNDIPEKKEKNLREFVIPTAFSTQKIIAAFDTTLFRSAKEGVVFTDTHCFAKKDELQIAFELKDLVSIRSMDSSSEGDIELILVNTNILVPGDFHAKELLEVYNAIING